MASPTRAAGTEPAEAGDVAKHVYLALRSKDAAAAARCVAEATDDDLLVRSPWEQRQENTPSGQDAPYATRGLTAVHVLARDCRDVDLLGAAGSHARAACAV